MAISWLVLHILMCLTATFGIVCCSKSDLDLQWRHRCLHADCSGLLPYKSYQGLETLQDSLMAMGTEGDSRVSFRIIAGNKSDQTSSAHSYTIYST